MVYWILSKCRKNFHDFCFICIESTAFAQSICRENFHESAKICETVLLFSRLAFVVYGTVFESTMKF